MIKSFFSIIFTFFCFLIFQVCILSNITILPSYPDLLLIILLFVSLHNGCLLAETTGFISGLLLDFLSAGPFGLNALIRTILGFILGFFNRTINTNGFFLPALLGFAVTILKYLLLLLVSFFFPSSFINGSLLSVAGLFELLMNTLLTPLVFMFLRLFSSNLIFDYHKDN